MLSPGSQVTVYGREGDFYYCKLPIGRFAYAPVKVLFCDSAYRTLNGAVDLRMYLPEAEFELLFASRNNITGEALYPPIPMMEESTAAHLRQAYEIFRADGYTIKVYDAYRPKSAQFKLYDAVQNGWFIANPYNGNSWHQLGRAIDMSLIDLKTGKELVMPTPMHTFSNDAARFNSKQWSDGSPGSCYPFMECCSGALPMGKAFVVLLEQFRQFFHEKHSFSKIMTALALPLKGKSAQPSRREKLS